MIIDLVFFMQPRHFAAVNRHIAKINTKNAKRPIITHKKTICNRADTLAYQPTVDGVRWHFWLVSNAYDDFAKHEIESGPDRERRLIAKGPRHIVGIKTWGDAKQDGVHKRTPRASGTFSDESIASRSPEKHRQYLEDDNMEEPRSNGDELAEARKIQSNLPTQLLPPTAPSQRARTVLEAAMISTQHSVSSLTGRGPDDCACSRLSLR
ncbi:hypothetical protein [Paracoccus mutanolyticus]|uniref:hypothetical protein n=1 Tax=Paracoccus mutanolyticus TaxID=1499308 RepID=UPI0011AE3EED|nr:hypothetical protein [Paracoccus mutanolyticus]